MCDLAKPHGNCCTGVILFPRHETGSGFPHRPRGGSPREPLAVCRPPREAGTGLGPADCLRVGLGLPRRHTHTVVALQREPCWERVNPVYLFDKRLLLSSPRDTRIPSRSRSLHEGAVSLDASSMPPLHSLQGAKLAHLPENLVFTLLRVESAIRPRNLRHLCLQDVNCGRTRPADCRYHQHGRPCAESVSVCSHSSHTPGEGQLCARTGLSPGRPEPSDDEPILLVQETGHV